MRHYSKRAWHFLTALQQEYSADNGALVAAAMSFFALLSLVPLLLVGVAVMGYVLGQEDAYARVFDFLGRFLAREQATDVQDLLEGIVRGRGTAGGIGLLVLLWTGSQFFVSLERAVNIAWDVRDKRGFFEQRLVAIGMVISAGILILISAGLTALSRILQEVEIPILGWDLSDLPWIWSFLGFLVPLVITIATFTLIYKFLPNRHVRARDAAIGGVVAGVFWEIAKLGFSWYVPRFTDYNAVYGSLGGVILLAIWIYYSSILTIIGAEVAAIAADAKRRSA